MKYIQNLVLVDDQDCVSQDICSSTVEYTTYNGYVAALTEGCVLMSSHCLLS